MMAVSIEYKYTRVPGIQSLYKYKVNITEDAGNWAYSSQIQI